MSDNALLILIESILGKGNKTSKGNYSFKCPFCSHHKNKFEINCITNEKNENPWHCWVCEKKGKTVKSLLKSLNIAQDRYPELKFILTPSDKRISIIKQISLPKEFISLQNASKLSKLQYLEAKRAVSFLKKRGITNEDVIKYNIGFCDEGPYKDRVIIPSYDDRGIINYFIARAYIDGIPSYKNPPIDAKTAIGWEMYINWDAPIIICEGIFDAITVKRNIIPLFGKIIHEKLMKKLVCSSVNKIYIALDPDALKKSLKYAEELMAYGKEIFMVQVNGKDINDVGFENFLNTIEQTQPLTFQTLLNLKMQND